jgi:hypothetical protein
MNINDVARNRADNSIEFGFDAQLGDLATNPGRIKGAATPVLSSLASSSPLVPLSQQLSQQPQDLTPDVGALLGQVRMLENENQQLQLLLNAREQELKQQHNAPPNVPNLPVNSNTPAAQTVIELQVDNSFKEIQRVLGREYAAREVEAEENNPVDSWKEALFKIPEKMKGVWWDNPAKRSLMIVAAIALVVASILLFPWITIGATATLAVGLAAGGVGLLLLCLAKTQYNTAAIHKRTYMQQRKDVKALKELLAKDANDSGQKSYLDFINQLKCVAAKGALPKGKLDFANAKFDVTLYQRWKQSPPGTTVAHTELKALEASWKDCEEALANNNPLLSQVDKEGYMARKKAILAEGTQWLLQTYHCITQEQSMKNLMAEQNKLAAQQKKNPATQPQRQPNNLSNLP